MHDFGCYPFPTQLSRGLAARGHRVTHTFAEQFSARSRSSSRDGDPNLLRFDPISVDVPFEKYSPRGRIAYERTFGDALVQRLRDEQPDVVVTANLPLVVARRLTRHARRSRLPWILWHQDVVSLAIGDEAGRRLPRLIARPARSLVEHIERRALRQAAAVVPIGEAFVEQYARWGLRLPRVELIPNWAPLDDIRPCPRDNAWAAERDLPSHELRLLYAGTLGRKHNPDLLVDLCTELRARGVPARMLVVSEGEGAQRVQDVAAGAPGVQVLPFQPTERLAEVLCAADVLVALLEPEASAFSIPSKVLSYLAAGRPVLGFVPASNAAARDIELAHGVVATPDRAGVRRAADWLEGLAADRDRIRAIGARSRAVAEEQFALEVTLDRFEGLLRFAAEGHD